MPADTPFNMYNIFIYNILTAKYHTSPISDNLWLYDFRPGISYPEITKMQVRAIFQVATDQQLDGGLKLCWFINSFISILDGGLHKLLSSIIMKLDTLRYFRSIRFSEPS